MKKFIFSWLFKHMRNCHNCKFEQNRTNKVGYQVNILRCVLDIRSGKMSYRKCCEKWEVFK